MGWWGRLWDLAYVWRSPWDIGGPRAELVRLVGSGELQPCRAIDLGCGAGENVIYLAQQGFDATLRQLGFRPRFSSATSRT